MGTAMAGRPATSDIAIANESIPCDNSINLPDRSRRHRSRLGTIMIARLPSCFAAALIVLAVCRAHAKEPLTFEQHVRPILKLHCFQCHGEEAEHEANLDLRLVRTLTKGGDSGSVIVPGKAAESLLIQRLSAGEMPPEGKGKPISPKELATIREWLDQGAKTARPEPESLADLTDDEKAFWSFQPIRSIPLPRGDDGTRRVPGEGGEIHSPI